MWQIIAQYVVNTCIKEVLPTPCGFTYGQTLLGVEEFDFFLTNLLHHMVYYGNSSFCVVYCSNYWPN